MKKASKDRIDPTRKERRILQEQLAECNWLYNHFLEERKTAWEKEKKSISYFDQVKSIPALKKQRSSLNIVHSQVLQNVAKRVDLAFRAFFRRVKAGEKPGYPRFMGSDRYDSFTFPQSGFKIVGDKLELSKIGSIKIRKHRKVKGTIKTLTIKRTASGKWYACFSYETELTLLPKVESVVGVDVGLTSFATLSTGEKIANPRFFKVDEKKLIKAQRKLSKAEKGTLRRKKAKKVVSHTHERITNRRSDFAHKLSRRLVNENQVIVFEKLDVKNMKESNTKVFGRKLNRSIADVAWNQFMEFTAYKAAEAGRAIVFVNPRNTSKVCSRCGQVVEKTLADRVHSCPCGLIMDRDENAAINILTLGLKSLGVIPKSCLR